MYEGRYQVPMSFCVDRTFVESGGVAPPFSFLKLWLVQGCGDFDLVREAVLRAHLRSHTYK